MTTLQPAESYDDYEGNVYCRRDYSPCEPAADGKYFCTSYPRHLIVDRVHTPLKPEE